MPLYCYIVETGYYEDREADILGHKEKYSQEEFDNICIEITEKYGDVEEIEYFSNYDKTDVKEIRYKIEAPELIEHLVSEYGFIELDLPINDGYNSREISRKPVPPERLRKVVIKTPRCPAVDGHEIAYKDSNFTTEFEVLHHNAKCNPFYKEEDSVD